MWSLLAEFARAPRRLRKVVVIDEASEASPYCYHVQPLRLLRVWGLTVVVAVLVAVGLLAFTPLKSLLPGYSGAQVRREARLNTLRVEALQDSLRVQQQYLAHLRRLMTGRVDSAEASAATPEPSRVVTGARAEVMVDPFSESWRDHAQPALPLMRLPVRRGENTPFRPVLASETYLSGLTFPVKPPVEGFITRRFDARGGHYALDIAVEEGTPVHAIGDGYVILAGWTRQGGGVIAVQHAGGYVSIYKHNQRLLKHTGDRVRDRETISRSGNTGEISTGPHLHVELWHDGLAQDPSRYFLSD